MSYDIPMVMTNEFGRYGDNGDLKMLVFNINLST